MLLQYVTITLGVCLYVPFPFLIALCVCALTVLCGFLLLKANMMEQQLV